MASRVNVFLLSIGSLLLAGCNSTDATLQPTPSDVTAAAQNGADSVALAATASTRFQLAPIVGAPVDKVVIMNRRLSMRVKERDLALVGPDSTNGTHVLKGYFSAFSEDSETTVVYVWDILDLSGNRLHRFQGQQKATSVPGLENWDAVSEETMQIIADRTSEALAGWAASS